MSAARSSQRRRAFVALVITAAAATACNPTVRPAPQNGSPVRIPREAARFDIESVTDSTVAFRAEDLRWLRIGMTGYAVDPARRDAFVARLAVIASTNGEYTSLVTGQVRPVDSTHAVIIVRPAPPWWRTRPFWMGLVAGGVAGAGIASVAR